MPRKSKKTVSKKKNIHRVKSKGQSVNVIVKIDQSKRTNPRSTQQKIRGELQPDKPHKTPVHAGIVNVSEGLPFIQGAPAPYKDKPDDKQQLTLNFNDLNKRGGNDLSDGAITLDSINNLVRTYGTLYNTNIQAQIKDIKSQPFTTYQEAPSTSPQIPIQNKPKFGKVRGPYKKKVKIDTKSPKKSNIKDDEDEDEYEGVASANPISLFENPTAPKKTNILQSEEGKKAKSGFSSPGQLPLPSSSKIRSDTGAHYVMLVQRARDEGFLYKEGDDGLEKKRKLVEEFITTYENLSHSKRARLRISMKVTFPFLKDILI